ncbi:MAG: DUF1028 domain-containing protein [Chloroflexi bacterium]|nr:DUF1028 domain-containing protein [Chloroflexota bacterium]
MEARRGSMSGMDAGSLVATFSIVAGDPANGDLGVAVASRVLGVGGVVPWAKAGVGAVATQAYSNRSFGPRGLALLAEGLSAADTLELLLRRDQEPGRRQAGVVDAQGRAAAHTGEGCSPWAGHVVGEGFCCQGNILTGPDVVQAMAAAFRSASGELATRLMEGLLAGDQAGGDSRGRQSAAIFVVRPGGSYDGTIDRYIDLRVDDHATPVQELARILALHWTFAQRCDPKDALPLEGDLCRELQATLATLGCYRGPAHGQFDPPTQQALRECLGRASLLTRHFDEPLIDPFVWEYLQRKAAG